MSVEDLVIAKVSGRTRSAGAGRMQILALLQVLEKGIKISKRDADYRIN